MIWKPFDTPDRFMTSWFQPLPETMKEVETLLANVFFLVKQGNEFGERLRCTECGRRHDYITLRCVPKPVTGLMNGLYAYYRAVKDFGVENSLSPSEQHRLLQVGQVLNQMPDLSSVHPQMARQLVKDIGPRDLQVGAVSLGLLEGISPTEARKLEEKINERGVRPPFKLAPVSVGDRTRSTEYRGLQYTNSRW